MQSQRNGWSFVSRAGYDDGPTILGHGLYGTCRTSLLAARSARVPALHIRSVGSATGALLVRENSFAFLLTIILIASRCSTVRRENFKSYSVAQRCRIFIRNELRIMHICGNSINSVIGLLLRGR